MRTADIRAKNLTPTLIHAIALLYSNIEEITDADDTLRSLIVGQHSHYCSELNDLDSEFMSSIEDEADYESYSDEFEYRKTPTDDQNTRMANVFTYQLGELGVICGDYTHNLFISASRED
ncbi:MAG: hypothetical protein M3H12_12565 [Chromatiales bacterium]|nr:hypothetical protein [Gammaproteobacteria bacterium]